MDNESRDMSPQDIAKFDQLRAEYSELLADYSFLKNNENVLLKDHARITINIEKLDDIQSLELVSAIAELVSNFHVEYTLQVNDGVAVYKTTGKPNEL